MVMPVHHVHLQLVQDVVKRVNHSLSYVFLSRPIRAKVNKYMSYPALNPQDAAKDQWFFQKNTECPMKKKTKRKYPNQQWTY